MLETSRKVLQPLITVKITVAKCPKGGELFVVRVALYFLAVRRNSLGWMKFKTCLIMGYPI